MIRTFEGLLGVVQGILDKVVPFIIGLGVFIIIWGIFTYLTHAANEEKRAEAKQFIIWGVVGVFCMLSVWGFVNILYNTFNLERQIDPSKIPRVPTVESGNRDFGGEGGNRDFGDENPNDLDSDGDGIPDYYDFD